MLTISTILLIGLLWTYFIFFKLNARINSNHHKLILTMKKNKLLQTSKKECKSLSQEIIKIKKELLPFIKKGRKTKNYQDNIASIIDYARQSGLALKTCTSTEKAAKKHLFSKQQTCYEFSGKIEHAFDFCHILKNCNDTIKIKEITIAKTDSNQCNIKCSLDFIFAKRI